MISLRDVSKTYAGGVQAVDRLSLDVASGETIVLLGASGCGKTTTLKMINRLVEPSAGEIYVDGKNTADVDPVLLRRSIGYVFQGIGLFPHWTVADNVAAIPRLLGWSENRIHARVDELLTRVGLRADAYRERRFGAVDPVTRDGLQQELVSMREQLGLTIVLVTHDVTEALLLADRVAIMDRGQILQIGRPAELFANPPASEVVERLLDMPRRQSEKLHEIVHSNDPRGGGVAP